MKHLISLGAALIVLVCLFAAFQPHFLTAANGINVLEQITIYALLAFGMTFVILTGGIDLSVGSVVALAGMTSVWFASETGSFGIGVVTGIAAALAIGAINGALVAFARLPPFIVTLGTMSIARGLAYVYTWENWGEPLYIDKSQTLFRNLANHQVLFLVLFFSAAVVLLHFTRFGHYTYAIGGNREAARFTGLPVRRTEFSVYLLTGGLAGAAGILNASLLYSADPSAAHMYELNAIAAVVVGGTSFTGGVGNLFGTLIGAVLLGVLSNGLNLLNVHFSTQYMVKGIVIILAVLIDALRRRGRGND